MGIKDLYKVIEKHSPNALGRVSITHYSGKRIAIDGHNWIYKNMYGARKISSRKTNFAVEDVNETVTNREWLVLCFNFIIKWMKFNVIPIFVFDGKDKPSKGETQKKRAEDYMKKKEAYADSLIKLHSLDVLDRTDEMVEEVKNNYSKFIEIDVNAVDNLINVLNLTGLPWLQAKGEAEQLCVMLALEGKVDAVYSLDGDNLALGCPVLIKEYGNYTYVDGQAIPTLMFYELNVILDELGLNMSEFLELCILLGCDYNKNIKGVGPVSAFKLISEYRTIENIQKAKNYDIECLNYQECINNFSKVSSSSITAAGYMDVKEPDIFAIRDVLEAYDISQFCGQIVNYMAECIKSYKEIEDKKVKIKKIRVIRVKK